MRSMPAGRFTFANQVHVQRTHRALALEKENAIADLRKLMAPPTRPAPKRAPSQEMASDIEHNAIHGSDADETARFELSFFFAGYELAQ